MEKFFGLDCLHFSAQGHSSLVEKHGMVLSKNHAYALFCLFFSRFLFLLYVSLGRCLKKRVGWRGRGEKRLSLPNPPLFSLSSSVSFDVSAMYASLKFWRHS